MQQDTDPGEPVVDAYRGVRSAIVEGRYAPGQRLVEQRIAADLGLSRTPVREALRRLEAEGLVVSERNRGASVRELSRAEVRDLYDLRIRLESYAAELAAERITADELIELQEAGRAFGEVRSRADLAGIEGTRLLQEANRAVHECILAASRHDLLRTMLARTVDIPLVFRSFRVFSATEVERSDLFHTLIIEAVAGRDPVRAGRLMAEHISQGRDVVLASMPDDVTGDQRRSFRNAN